MEDDLTPNDSEALGVYEPEEPAEVQQQDKKELNKVAIARAVAEDIIGWFESVLRDAETIDAVNKSKNTYKITTDEAFVAHHVLATEVTNLLAKFKSQFTQPKE